MFVGYLSGKTVGFGEMFEKITRPTGLRLVVSSPFVNVWVKHYRFVG